MKRSFDDHVLDDLGQRLRPLTDDIAERYPGEPTDRQPVHTVYGGAQLFRSGTARRLGDLALRELDRYAPDAAEFDRRARVPTPPTRRPVDGTRC